MPAKRSLFADRVQLFDPAVEDVPQTTDYREWIRLRSAEL